MSFKDFLGLGEHFILCRGTICAILVEGIMGIICVVLL